MQGYYLSPYPRETNVFLGLDGSSVVDVTMGYPLKEYAGSGVSGRISFLRVLLFEEILLFLYRSADKSHKYNSALW